MLHDRPFSMGKLRLLEQREPCLGFHKTLFGCFKTPSCQETGDESSDKSELVVMPFSLSRRRNEKH